MSGLSEPTSELAAAVLAGDEPIFHPNTGKPIEEVFTLHPAAAAGLDVPRYCQICGHHAAATANANTSPMTVSQRGTSFFRSSSRATSSSVLRKSSRSSSCSSSWRRETPKAPHRSDPEHSREPAGQHGLDRCSALGVSRRHDDEHDDERDDFRDAEDDVARPGA